MTFYIAICFDPPEVSSSGNSYKPFNWCVLNVLYGVSPVLLLVLQLFKSVVQLLLLQLFGLESLWVGQLGCICQTDGMFLFFCSSWGIMSESNSSFVKSEHS